jgi:hypothetical protein
LVEPVAAPGHQRDGGTLVSQHLGGRRPDSAASAGNECDSACESMSHVTS